MLEFAHSLQPTSSLKRQNHENKPLKFITMVGFALALPTLQISNKNLREPPSGGVSIVGESRRG